MCANTSFFLILSRGSRSCWLGRYRAWVLAQVQKSFPGGAGRAGEGCSEMCILMTAMRRAQTVSLGGTQTIMLTLREYDHTTMSIIL